MHTLSWLVDTTYKLEEFLEAGVARIPDAELVKLKTEVSVQRLVEGCGVSLACVGRAATSWVRVRSMRMTPRRWW